MVVYKPCSTDHSICCIGHKTCCSRSLTSLLCLYKICQRFVCFLNRKPSQDGVPGGEASSGKREVWGAPSPPTKKKWWEGGRKDNFVRLNEKIVRGELRRMFYLTIPSDRAIPERKNIDFLTPAPEDGLMGERASERVLWSIKHALWSMEHVWW